MYEAGNTLFKRNEAAIMLMELRAGVIMVLRFHMRPPDLLLLAWAKSDCQVVISVTQARESCRGMVDSNSTKSTNSLNGLAPVATNMPESLILTLNGQLLMPRHEKPGMDVLGRDRSELPIELVIQDRGSIADKEHC